MGDDFISDDPKPEFYLCGTGWVIARSQVAAAFKGREDVVRVALKSGEFVTVDCDFDDFLSMLGRQE